MILLYDSNSIQDSVNQAYKQLLTQKDKTIDRHPPTQAPMIQLTKSDIGVPTKLVTAGDICCLLPLISHPQVTGNGRGRGGWKVY